MKILLVKDRATDINLKLSADILNSLCRANKFEESGQPVELGMQSAYVDFNAESTQLENLLALNKVDQIFYCTSRRYDNNYFFYSNNAVTILSYHGWKHCTKLPLENGLFYFIAVTQALVVDNSVRHEDTTGCVYDFLWDKTAVDIGMKTGHFCKDCLTRVEEKVKESQSLSNILGDVVTILRVLSSSSKWGNSVFDYEKQAARSSDWASFEDDVAQIYRKLGARVQQNVNLAGFQTDILVEERPPSKQNLRSAIECKFSKNKVGNKIVNDFVRIVNTLKGAHLVDKGIIVSQSGFTQDAYLVSKETHIELLNIEDLKQAIAKATPDLVSEEKDEDTRSKSMAALLKVEESTQKIREQKSPHLFAIIPFSSDMDDVYYLGIHETARALGCSCDKVDQMEFVGPILDKLYDSIKNSRIVLAELSTPNVNVYYELGYAHALGKPTILITKDISASPFDVRGYNHIVYSSIRDLRSKLKARLEAILTQVRGTTTK